MTPSHAPAPRRARRLPAAISKTTPGGEIDVLDPGGFGAVTITKAISIEAAGVIAGVSVSGTNGIIINAGPNDVVVLRGLTIEGLGTGLNGIRFLAGKALHIENCTINHFSQAGIDAEPTADAALYVTNTVSRSNAMNGILIAPSGNGSVEASLDTVQLLGNQNGLNASGFYNISVRNSMIARNSVNGVQATTLSSSINLESSTIANNQGNGVNSANGAAVRISNLMITGNNRGLFASGGQIASYGNNRIGGNGTNGAPTMTVSQQ